MSGKVDIHDYKNRLERAVRLLRDSEIPRQDRELILKFADVLRAERISLGRVAKYVYMLKRISELLEEKVQLKDGFKGADAASIGKLNAWLSETSNYTAHTKRDFIITLKRFYQGLRSPPDEYVRQRNFVTEMASYLRLCL